MLGDQMAMEMQSWAATWPMVALVTCVGLKTALGKSREMRVCNCNKYLKVSRERMRQLVESSRQASEEHSAGKQKWMGAVSGKHMQGQEEMPSWGQCQGMAVAA
ncbi:hypothetical protein TURU_032807 [Turdus rufiventris]|nr:hypothetical protein TURU_032807 [Turdus rufiventris]